MKSGLHLLLFIFILRFVDSTKQHFDPLISSFVSSFAQANSNGCVYLLVNCESVPLAFPKEWVNFVRASSTDIPIPVAVAPIQKFDPHLNAYKCRRLTTLAVLLTLALPRFTIQRLTQYDLNVMVLMILPKEESTLWLEEVIAPINSQVFLLIISTSKKMSLSEIYRLQPNEPLEDHYLAKWMPDSHFQKSHLVLQALIYRRNQFHGVHVKALTYENQRYTQMKEINGIMVFEKGYFGLIWNAIQEKLNFRTDLILTKDPSWLGNSQSPYQLNASVPVAIQPLVFKRERKEFVDFLTPIITVRNYIFIRKAPHGQLQWSSVAMPFGLDMWLALCINMLVISFFGMLIKILGNRIWTDNNESLSDIIMKLVGSFLSQGYDSSNLPLSLRIVFVTSYIVTVVVIAGYSAKLISSLTIYKERLPFTDFNGLLKDGTYKFGLLDISRGMLPITNVHSGVLYQIYKKLMEPDPDNFPKSEVAAINRVCKIKYAFLASKNLVENFIRTGKYCQMIDLPIEIVIRASMVIAKKHPLLYIFNNLLFRMRESGVLQRLHKQIFIDEYEDQEEIWTPVTLESATPILVIVLLGVVLGIFILTFEHFCSIVIKEIKKSDKK